MIKRLIWTIWTPMSSVLKKADKLNLSLSLSMGIYPHLLLQYPMWYSYISGVTMLCVFKFSFHLKCLTCRSTYKAWGCFTNVSWALQNDLAKIYNARNHIHGEHLKLKLCTCVQNIALGTCTKFQLQILIRSTISAIHKFLENIL